MWGLVQDGSITKLINNPKAMVIGDVRHSKNIFSFRWTKEERQAIGIYELEFDNEYDCLVTGYEESLKKIQEIGEIDVNEHRMYIKFGCYELEPENQET